ncbi:hypothetical protein Sjap_013037 [Stephania japonica]|uniref:Uncharacterized protein n=1 Tax=Stephania japonica TaxID=461633 RepID=A0AAP0IYD6_9MAGN
MEARRDTTGLFLTQTAYIKQLLQKGGMLQAKAVDTPALVGKPLFSDTSPHFSMLRYIVVYLVVCNTWFTLDQILRLSSID